MLHITLKNTISTKDIISTFDIYYEDYILFFQLKFSGKCVSMLFAV